MRRTFLLMVFLTVVAVLGFSGCEDILDFAEEAAEAAGVTESYDENSTFGKEVGELNKDETKTMKLGEGTYCAIYEEKDGVDINDLLSWLFALTDAKDVTEAPQKDVIGKCDVTANVNGDDFSYVVYFYEESSVKAEVSSKAYKSACTGIGGEWTANSN